MLLWIRKNENPFKIWHFEESHWANVFHFELYLVSSFSFFKFISFFYEWWNVSCSGRFFPFKAALGGATPSSQGVGSIYKELWKTASLWPNRFHLPALLTEEGCCTWLGSDGTPAHNSYTSDSERSGEARTDQDASTSCWHSRDLFLVRVFSFCRVLYRW